MPSTSHSSGGGWLLSKSRMFERLQLVDTKAVQQRGGQPSYKPIVAISGERCFAWKKSKNALLVIPTGEVFKEEDSPPEDTSDIQEWQLSQRLGFEVTNIVPFPAAGGSFGGVGASSVLLWGKNGLAVVTNQNVSTNFVLNGSSSSSSGNTEVQRMIKKTILIGEKTYIDHPNLSVIQAKWLPCTFNTNSKTVVVLNSDNYFRFYQVENIQGKEAVSCGSVSIEANSTTAIPFINRTGRFAADVEDESAADFDVGPCLPKSKYYPLFVLRESGLVSYVLIRFVGKNPVPFSEVHDVIQTVGYVSEDRTATSLIVSKEFPMFVAIGFTGGVITHSLLLPDFDDSINDNGKIDQGQNMEEKFLYDGFHLIVKERLDLDFLANSTHNHLKLILDPLHSHRYASIMILYWRNMTKM